MSVPKSCLLESSMSLFFLISATFYQILLDYSLDHSGEIQSRAYEFAFFLSLSLSLFLSFSLSLSLGTEDNGRDVKEYYGEHEQKQQQRYRTFRSAGEPRPSIRAPTAIH